MNDRERTVSGAGRAEVRIALRGSSVGLLHGEPDRSRPHSLRTHRKCCSNLPAGSDTARGKNWKGSDGVDHLGPQHDAADLTAVSAAFVSLGDKNIDTGFFLRERMLGRAAQCRHQAARVVDTFDHVGRRSAERVGDQLDLRMPQRNFNLRRSGGSGPSKQIAAAFFFRRQIGDAVTLENLIHERAMLRRNRRDQLLLEFDRIDFAHALVLSRDDDIDAVGLVSYLRIDPLQLVLELGSGIRECAEHSESASLGDGGNHVAAMAERENWKLDSKSIAKLGMHR